MQDQAVRDRIWQEFFGAEVRYRYFGTLAGKLSSRDKWLATCATVGSSAAFIALVAKIPDAALLLSAMVAVASGILAKQKYEKAAALNADLGRRWGEIKMDYGVLWLEVDDIDKSSALERYRQIEEKKVSPADALAIGKVDDKLWVQCQQQARKAGAFERAA